MVKAGTVVKVDTADVGQNHLFVERNLNITGFFIIESLLV
jgi:hypothetical protein